MSADLEIECVGRNWHQVVGSRTTGLAEGLPVGECRGMNKLLIGASADNESLSVIAFDDRVRRTFAGKLTSNPQAPLEAPSPMPLEPGAHVGFDLEKDFDAGQLVYAAAQSGLNDLYVMCYR